MAVLNEKQSLAHHHGILWNMMNWLEEHLKGHKTRRESTTSAKGKVKKADVVFFEGTSELDDYMKTIR